MSTQYTAPSVAHAYAGRKEAVSQATTRLSIPPVRNMPQSEGYQQHVVTAALCPLSSTS